MPASNAVYPGKGKPNGLPFLFSLMARMPTVLYTYLQLISKKNLAIPAGSQLNIKPCNCSEKFINCLSCKVYAVYVLLCNRLHILYFKKQFLSINY